jgi:hypothetical protein
MSICRDFFTGATGLEPATSGVTGRYDATGSGRLRPGITGYSGHFFTERTGCDRLRPASTRHSLCGMCVVGVVPTSTTSPSSLCLSMLDAFLIMEDSACGHLTLGALR